MNDVDAKRIAALARAFDAAPRQVVLAAARLARDTGDAAAHPHRRRDVLAAAHAPTPAEENVAALLTTPIASFAQDDVDHALASAWPPQSNPDA